MGRYGRHRRCGRSETRSLLLYGAKDLKRATQSTLSLHLKPGRRLAVIHVGDYRLRRVYKYHQELCFALERPTGQLQKTKDVTVT